MLVIIFKILQYMFRVIEKTEMLQNMLKNIFIFVN